MTGFADRPLSEMLDEVAARSPAPGGGSSAAWACALGAALAQMSARFGAATGGDEAVRDRLATVVDRAAEARRRLLELAERDLDSYRSVLAVRRLPRDDPERNSRLESALAQASEVPLEIARLAAEVAGLGAEVADVGAADVRGDAIVSVLLAEAAGQSATSLVELNLVGRPTDPVLDEARAAAERAERSRRRVLRG